MNKILITLLVCTGLFSCSKDDALTNNNAYKPENVIIADEPVMYTNNGVIHDQSLMKGYLQRRGFTQTAYAFDKATPQTAAFSSYTLEFKAGKNVLMGNVNGEIIEQNDSLILIAGLESAVPAITKKSWSDSLIDKVNINGPLSECPAYYTNPCSYRKKYPLQIINGEYYIPYVVVTASTNADVPTPFGVPMDYTEHTYEAGQSMLFNKTMTTQLGGTIAYEGYTLQRRDTVLIQTMRQRLIKQ